MKRKLVTRTDLHKLYYEQGLSQSAIAKELGVSPMTISHRMDEYGFQREPRGLHKGHIPESTLRKLYLEDELSMAEIGRIVDRVSSNVLEDLRLYGIETRLAVRTSPGYSYNEHFFDTWSPEMAWVLGLLFADGNVRKHSAHAYGCTLISKDRDMLRQVLTLTGSEAPIRTPPSRSVSNIRVLVGDCAQLLVEKYGLVPNKSRKMLWPNPSDEVLSHFARGLWDGDGTFGSKRRWPRPVYCTGSEMFAYSFHAMIPVPSVLKRYQQQYKPYWLISVNARERAKFLDWLYKGSTETTRLARKYKVVKEHIPN